MTISAAFTGRWQNSNKTHETRTLVTITTLEAIDLFSKNKIPKHGGRYRQLWPNYYGRVIESHGLLVVHPIWRWHQWHTQRRVRLRIHHGENPRSNDRRRPIDRLQTPFQNEAEEYEMRRWVEGEKLDEEITGSSGGSKRALAAAQRRNRLQH